MARHRITWAVYFVCLLPAGARAQSGESSVDVTWTAPEVCPDLDQVTAEIERLIGRSLAGLQQPRLSVRATVARRRGGFSLQLLTALDGEPGERQLDSPTCDELGRAAALVIALAIDPDSAQRASTADQRSDTAPASDPSITPRAEQSDGADSGGDAERPDEASPLQGRAEGEADEDGENATADSNVDEATELPPPRDEVEEDDEIDDEVEDEAGDADGSPPGVSLRLELVGDVGTLPGPSLGAGLALGIDVARVRIELAGRYLAPAQVERDGQEVAELRIAAIAVAACYALLDGALRLGPCAAVEVGSLWGEGTIAGGQSGATAFSAAFAGLGVAYRVAGPISLALEVGANLPFKRTRFRVEGLDEVHRPGLASLRGAAGAEARF